jgi:predicted metal-binding membrane protein
MNGSPALTRRFGPETFRRALAWHPEWWVLAMSAVAWYLILAPPVFSGGEICGVFALTESGLVVGGWAGSLYDWLVMVLAMMLPLILFPVRATAFGSLWRRRHWAIGTFLASYLAVWLAAGALGLFLLDRGREVSWVIPNGWIAAASLVALSGWQLTESKRRLAVACHQTRPLAPDGWKAQRDCLIFGASQGRYCVANCGALMLVAILSPWHQLMMIAAAMLLLYERYRPRPRDRKIAVALGLLACAHGVAAILA